MPVNFATSAETRLNEINEIVLIILNVRPYCPARIDPYLLKKAGIYKLYIKKPKIQLNAILNLNFRIKRLIT